MPENDRLTLDSSEHELRDVAAAAPNSPEGRLASPQPLQRPDDTDQVMPYVLEGLTYKALHFSISEIQSRMRLDDPIALDLEYTRMMMAFLLFVPDPRRIAMIGLGGGSLAKFCYRHVVRARIEVVEINPHVIALRNDFHVPRDDARFRVIAGDGARYVRDQREHCDVLVVDGFDSSGQPSRLCSSRFYDDARDMLAPGGVMVVNLHAGHRRHETHVARIRRSFGQAVLAVDDFEGSNQIVFALKAPAFEIAPEVSDEQCASLGSAANRQLRSAFHRVRAAQRNQLP